MKRPSKFPFFFFFFNLSCSLILFPRNGAILKSTPQVDGIPSILMEGPDVHSSSGTHPNAPREKGKKPDLEAG